MQNHKCWRNSNDYHEIPHEKVIKERTELKSSCASVGADGDKVEISCTGINITNPTRNQDQHHHGFKRLWKLFESHSQSADDEKWRQCQVENEHSFQRLSSLFPLSTTEQAQEHDSESTIIVKESLIDDFVCYDRASCICSCQTKPDETKLLESELSESHPHRYRSSDNEYVGLGDRCNKNSFDSKDSYNSILCANANVNPNHCKNFDKNEGKNNSREEKSKEISQNVKNGRVDNDDDNEIIDTNTDVLTMLLKNTIRSEHIEFQKKLHFLPINENQKTKANDTQIDFDFGSDFETGSRKLQNENETKTLHANERSSNDNDNDDCWFVGNEATSLALHESVLFPPDYYKDVNQEPDIKIGTHCQNESKSSKEMNEWVSSGTWMHVKNMSETPLSFIELLTPRKNENEKSPRDKGSGSRKSCEERKSDHYLNCCGDDDDLKINSNDLPLLPTYEYATCKNKIQKMFRKSSISASNETVGFIAKRFKETGYQNDTSDRVELVEIPEFLDVVEVDEAPPQEFSVEEMSENENDGEIPGPSHSHPMNIKSTERLTGHDRHHHQESSAVDVDIDVDVGDEENQSTSSIYHAAHTESLMSNLSLDQNRRRNNTLLSSSDSVVSGIDMDRQPLQEQMMKCKGMQVWLNLNDDFDGDPLDFDEGSTQAMQMDVLWANRRFLKQDDMGKQEITIPEELMQHENGLSNLSFSGDEHEDDSPSNNFLMTLGMKKAKAKSKAKVKKPCDSIADRENIGTEHQNQPQGVRLDGIKEIAVATRTTGMSLSMSNESSSIVLSVCSDQDGDSVESFAMSIASSTEQISYEASLSEADDVSIYDVEYMGRWDIFWPLMTKSERQMIGAPSNVDFAMENQSSRGFVTQPDDDGLRLTETDNHQEYKHREATVDIEEIHDSDTNQSPSFDMEPEVGEEATEVEEYQLKSRRIRRGPGHTSGGDTYAKLESCQVLYVTR